jgi:hypothetical protein
MIIAGDEGSTLITSSATDCMSVSRFISGGLEEEEDTMKCKVYDVVVVRHEMIDGKYTGKAEIISCDYMPATNPKDVEIRAYRDLSDEDFNNDGVEVFVREYK